MKKARSLFYIFTLLFSVLIASQAHAAGNLTMEKDRVDMTGDLSISGQYGGRIYVIGDSTGAVTIDWNNGNTQHITLTGNVTLTFSNGRSGTKHTVIILQDGTGGHTVTWPDTTVIRWAAVGAAEEVTTTASRTDYYGFIYNSVSARYDCVGAQKDYGA